MMRKEFNCYTWPPINNFVLIKIYDAGRLDKYDSHTSLSWHSYIHDDMSSTDEARCNFGQVMARLESYYSTNMSFTTGSNTLSGTDEAKATHMFK